MKMIKTHNSKKPSSFSVKNNGRTYTEYSAGGIVFRIVSSGHALRGGVEIAFLLDPFAKWTFAKGHIEQGETQQEAAVREVREEMDIKKIRVIADLGRIDWWFKERRATGRSPKGAQVHKYAYYFLMQVPEKTKLTAQKSERIQAVRWVPLDKALAFSDYQDVQSVLKKAVAILKRYEAHR